MKAPLPPHTNFGNDHAQSEQHHKEILSDCVRQHSKNTNHGIQSYKEEIKCEFKQKSNSNSNSNQTRHPDGIGYGFKHDDYRRVRTHAGKHEMSTYTSTPKIKDNESTIQGNETSIKDEADLESNLGQDVCAESLDALQKDVKDDSHDELSELSQYDVMDVDPADSDFEKDFQ